MKHIEIKILLDSSKYIGPGRKVDPGYRLLFLIVIAIHELELRALSCLKILKQKI